MSYFITRWQEGQILMTKYVNITLKRSFTSHNILFIDYVFIYAILHLIIALPFSDVHISADPDRHHNSTTAAVILGAGLSAPAGQRQNRGTILLPDFIAVSSTVLQFYSSTVPFAC